MKLITLHEPYASLIARGIKTYETRHWETDYRGKVLIHAAKQKIDNYGKDLLRKLSVTNCPTPSDMEYGNIVAMADLVDCLLMCNDSPQACTENGRISITAVPSVELQTGCWMPGRYALKLENVSRLVNPIPFKSRQSKLLDVTVEWAAIKEQASIKFFSPQD